MRTIAGVAAKGNNVIDTIRRNIVNNMMEAMHKRWNSLINESDDSNFFTLIGFLKSVDTEIEPQIYHENEEISFCRNAFGVGTLYWHETDNYIFYASEIKALFKIGGLTPQPDIQGIAENFVYWVPLRNRTVFQNICRLESNQIVKFNRSGVRIVDTSIVPLISSKGSKAPSSISNGINLIRSQIERNVSNACKQNDRLAIYLSGGLDSSILLYEVNKQKKHSEYDIICMTFEDRLFDESNFQRIMADSVGRLKDTKNIKVDKTCLFNCFEAAISDIEFPIMKLNPVSLWHLAKEVSKIGIDTIITGEGADELFWGYDFFQEELAAQEFSSGGINAISNDSIVKQIGQGNLSYYFKEYHKNDDILSPLRARYENSKTIIKYLATDINNVNFANAENELIEKMTAIYGDCSSLRTCQSIAMSTLLPEYLVTQQSSQIVGNRKLHTIMPFLTEKMLEISFSLPEPYLLNETGVKFILRKAYENDLPKQILHRRKYQLSTPGAEMLLNTDPELIYKHLSKESMAAHGIFSFRAVQHLLQRIRLRPVKTNGFSLDSMLLTYILSTQVLFNTAKEKWIESAKTVRDC